MIQKTRAVVLHQLKYGESSLILTLYTEHFGRQSYIINGIRSSKSRQKTGLLQALFLLEIDTYHKPGRDLQRLKEFKISDIYHSIPDQIVKSTIALFLAELLFKTLNSEEEDKNLFDFISKALLFFDEQKEGFENFHLWFMVQLLAYLGFKLETKQSPGEHWFNMKSGNFVNQRPSFPNTPNPEESEQLSKLIQLQADDLAQLKINGKTRSRLLEILVEYYRLHFDSISKINSLEVLKEVFR